MTATTEIKEREHYSVPEKRVRLSIVHGGRTRRHIVTDSNSPSANNPGRWTRRGVDRRSLCGSLRYVLVGVDVIDWPTARAPIDTSHANCPRCLARYARIFPTVKESS